MISFRFYHASLPYSAISGLKKLIHTFPPVQVRMSSFRGASIEQDSRYTDKQAKLKSQMNFSPLFAKPIDATKLSDTGISILSLWCTKRIKELLGHEDDVLIGLIINTIEVSRKNKGERGRVSGPDLQILVTGFLHSHAAEFTLDLYRLLLSACASPRGTPDLEVLTRAREAHQQLQAQQAARKAAQTQQPKAQPVVEDTTAPPAMGFGKGGFVPLTADMLEQLAPPPSEPSPTPTPTRAEQTDLKTEADVKVEAGPPPLESGPRWGAAWERLAQLDGDRGTDRGGDRGRADSRGRDRDRDGDRDRNRDRYPSSRDRRDPREGHSARHPRGEGRHEGRDRWDRRDDRRDGDRDGDRRREDRYADRREDRRDDRRYEDRRQRSPRREGDRRGDRYEDRRGSPRREDPRDYRDRGDRGYSRHSRDRYPRDRYSRDGHSRDGHGGRHSDRHSDRQQDPR
jgi:hypothetical protein